jgi:hypothetical protein
MLSVADKLRLVDWKPIMQPLAGKARSARVAIQGVAGYNSSVPCGKRDAVPYFEFLWTDDIIRHLSEHGIDPDEFEQIVTFPETRAVSRSSGRPCCWGELADGRYVMCVFEMLDDITILPVTAYEAPMPGEDAEP